MLGTNCRGRTDAVRCSSGPAGPATGLSRHGFAEGTRAARLVRLVVWWASVGVFALGAWGGAQAAPPTVWVAPSLVRVRPTDAVQSATTMSLYAAKGETESFQIIVQAPAGGLSNVNVQAPDLGGPQVTLYRENYLYLSSGSGDWSSNRNKPLGPGYYPDALVPFINPNTGQPLTGGTIVGAPFAVAAGQNQPVWVDVYVPPSTPAGTYSGTFTVTSAQGNASVTLSLRVWNFTLPLKPALKSCFMYWGTSSGGQNRGVLQSDSELLRNRLNPVSTSTSYERQLIDTLGLQSVSLPFWSNASNSGTMDPAPSVSSIQAAKAPHQQDLYFYCYSADEISSSSLYSTIQAWGRNLHSAGVDQLITMSPVPALYDDGSGTGRSAVDVWVMLPKMYDASRSYVQYVQQKGDKTWSYNCLQQDDYSPKWLLDYAPINYRIQPGFINQTLGLNGLLYWRVDWWTSDPYNNVQAWSGMPGEGMLVYPGAQVGLTGQVVPSMRLKYLRDGVDDYDYVQLLKQQGQGDWALSITRTIGPDWSNWSRDPNALEAARVQLGNRLDSLAGGTETVTVTASASPATVPSGGTTALTASATDSAGKSIVSWAWSDGGAGGSFSPSASTQNPTYTAPVNSGGGDLSVTLSVVASSGTASGTGTVGVSVQSVATHTLSLNCYASPSVVASGGTTSLTAAASDSLGHSISYTWSEGGAGGSFSPSAAAPNPTYTAAANASGVTWSVTLTVTATCSGPSPITKSASTTLSVQSVAVAHAVTVTASASPTTIASGGTTALTMSAVDSQGHTGLAWQWSDNGAGGTFSPSATVPNANYTAAANTTGGPRTITLTATGICEWQYPWVPGSKNLTITETTAPVPHTLTVTASASPTTINSGSTTTLTASAADSQGHTTFTWAWSDSGAGGSFSPSAAVQNPTYTPPANTSGQPVTRTLRVTATCSATVPPVSGSATVIVTENPASSFPRRWGSHRLTVRRHMLPPTVRALTGSATRSR